MAVLLQISLLKALHLAKSEKEGLKEVRFDMPMYSTFLIQENGIAAVNLGLYIAEEGFELPFDPPFAHVQAEFLYRISDLDQLMVQHEDQQVPEYDLGLLYSLAGVSYSTLRGMVYEHLARTPFGKGILPIIAPQAVLSLPDDLESAIKLLKDSRKESSEEAEE